MKPQVTLVSALGGQPQVITFLLDLLLARSEPIDQVTIVYLSGNERYQRAFQKLSLEFSDGQYAARKIQFSGITVLTDGQPLNEAVDRRQVEAVRLVFQDLFDRLKSEKQAVHLGVSAGRRILSVVGLSTALRYLTPEDRVWHLSTPPQIEEQAYEGALMHVASDAGIRLIEVPFVPWAAYFPGLAPLLERSPREVLGGSGAWLSDLDRERCGRVWGHLAPRRREVLQAYAAGLSRQEIALRLSVEVSTIDSHRKGILDVCQDIWGSDLVDPDNRFLLEKFGPFLRSLELV